MKKMKSKIFGMIALMAFAFSLVFAGVERVNMDDFIWVYEDGSTTMSDPDCITLPVDCAFKYHYDPSKPNGIGEPVIEDGAHVKVEGVKRNP